MKRRSIVEFSRYILGVAALSFGLVGAPYLNHATGDSSLETDLQRLEWVIEANNALPGLLDNAANFDIDLMRLGEEQSRLLKAIESDPGWTRAIEKKSEQWLQFESPSLPIVLRQVPPKYSSLRGLFSGDCQSSCAFQFGFDPNETIFTIHRPDQGVADGGLRKAKGTVNATRLLVNGKPTLYINAIGGPRLSKVDCDQVVKLLQAPVALQALQVEQVAIPTPEFISSTFNFSEARDAFLDLTKQSHVGPAEYLDQNRRIALEEFKSLYSSDRSDYIKNNKSVMVLPKPEQQIDAKLILLKSEVLAKNSRTRALELALAFEFSSRKSQAPRILSASGISQSEYAQWLNFFSNPNNLSVEEFSAEVQKKMSWSSTELAEKQFVLMRGFLSSPNLKKIINKPEFKAYSNNAIKSVHLQEDWITALLKLDQVSRLKVLTRAFKATYPVYYASVVLFLKNSKLLSTIEPGELDTLLKSLSELVPPDLYKIARLKELLEIKMIKNSYQIKNFMMLTKSLLPELLMDLNYVAKPHIEKTLEAVIAGDYSLVAGELLLAIDHLGHYKIRQIFELFSTQPVLQSLPEYSKLMRAISYKLNCKSNAIDQIRTKFKEI